MQAVSNQLPYYEKWIPNSELGEVALDDCPICFSPLDENPDPDNKDLILEVFGHRQDNVIFHKVHLYCLKQWIAARNPSLTVNNTVLCPGACGSLINCDVVYSPSKALAEFKNRASQAHLLGFVVSTVGLIYVMSIVGQLSRVLYEQTTTSTFIAGSVTALSAYHWKKTELPALIDQNIKQTATKTDLLADALIKGAAKGIAISIALMYYSFVLLSFCLYTAGNEWPDCFEPSIRKE